MFFRGSSLFEFFGARTGFALAEDVPMPNMKTANPPHTSKTWNVGT